MSVLNERCCDLDFWPWAIDQVLSWLPSFQVLSVTWPLITWQHHWAFLLFNITKNAQKIERQDKRWWWPRKEKPSFLHSGSLRRTVTCPSLPLNWMRVTGQSFEWHVKCSLERCMQTCAARSTDDVAMRALALNCPHLRNLPYQQSGPTHHEWAAFMGGGSRPGNDH